MEQEKAAGDTVHQAQERSCRRVKDRFPGLSERARVLDCGSLDINGSNRICFEDCDYLGLDLAPGKNVDVVSPIHRFSASDSCFDTTISTETFEHDMCYPLSPASTVRMLRPGGFLLLTRASTGRREHGTSKRHPFASPFTSSTPQWADYCKDLTEQDAGDALPVSLVFQAFELDSDETRRGLYFWGIKRMAPPEDHRPVQGTSGACL